jgi:acetoin utilization protein AcuB
MTAPAVSVPPQLRMFPALKLMNDKKIRRVPVVEGRKLVGILTKSDIYGALGPVSQWGAFEEGSEPSVSDYMTPDPATIEASAPIEEAAALMHEKRISGLPVVEGKRLVGVITETDLFRAFVEMMGVDEGGARLAFRLGEPKNLLDEIAKRTAGMAVRSVATFRRKDGWHAVVRVRGRAK